MPGSIHERGRTPGAAAADRAGRDRHRRAGRRGVRRACGRPVLDCRTGHAGRAGRRCRRVARPRRRRRRVVARRCIRACVLGASGHFASLFMGLELLSVSLFILIAWHCLMPRSIEAGVKYLVLAGLASGFALFGMALVYAEIGALDFAALADVERAGAWWWAGIALLLAGLAFKLSLVPFHFWTPDVYQGAPLPVTADRKSTRLNSSH